MSLRRLPLGALDKVGAELRRLEELGVIESISEPSPWISALLVVAKPDGLIRICIDPKTSLVGAMLHSDYRRHSSSTDWRTCLLKLRR